MEKERTGLRVCKILNDWSITSRQKNQHTSPGHLVVHPLRGGGIELSQSGIGMMDLGQVGDPGSSMILEPIRSRNTKRQGLTGTGRPLAAASLGSGHAVGR